MSTGVIIGLAGLAAFTAGLIWICVNSLKNVSKRAPFLLLYLSVTLCILGYLLTPTGMANLRLIIARFLY